MAGPLGNYLGNLDSKNLAPKLEAEIRQGNTASGGMQLKDPVLSPDVTYRSHYGEESRLL